MERLRKDLGAVNMTPPPASGKNQKHSSFFSLLEPAQLLPASGEAGVAGPSDLILTSGNPDEEEPVDSDTDDIDHSGEKTNIKNRN